MSDVVAPHAGAWIETGESRRSLNRKHVAPHAGAWIETPTCYMKGYPCQWSPPMRGRGLKRSCHGVEDGYRRRPPCGGVD